jgi:hypothetical protein
LPGQKRILKLKTQFEGKLIDIRGKQRDIKALENDALWLKKNIMAQALPNSLCTLPLQQKRCPHANACLCVFRSI